MAQQSSRLNLTNYNFPLLSTGVGASIILGSKLDVASEVPGGQREPAMQPELIYCENLLPTTEGYRSCVFTEVIAAAIAPASAAFGTTYNVTEANGALGLFSPAGGTNQLWKGSGWVGTGIYGAGISTSHANITGQSYICWALNQVKRVNVTAGTVSRLTGAGDTLVGITEANIKVICASGNYLIAAGEQTISWSSPTNPMDFTPSLITGAGTATPSDLKGRIIALVQIAQGFIIYTTQNAVSAIASGNAQFPFIFKHVAGSTGVQGVGDSVTSLIADSSIAWTLDGLHEVQPSGVKAVLPDVTDFLAARIIESYDVATGVITSTSLTADLFVAVHRISERYALVSYGVTATFTQALLFDSALKRWGKLVIPHTEVLSLPSNAVTANRQLCFLAADGSVKQLSIDAAATGATGVAIFGRVTLTRSSVTCVQTVQLESPKAADVLTVKLGTSYRGGQRQDSLVALTGSAIGAVREYPARITGAAHTLHLAGMLNLTSLVVITTQGGTR